MGHLDDRAQLYRRVWIHRRRCLLWLHLQPSRLDMANLDPRGKIPSLFDPLGRFLTRSFLPTARRSWVPSPHPDDHQRTPRHLRARLPRGYYGSILYVQSDTRLRRLGGSDRELTVTGGVVRGRAAPLSSRKPPFGCPINHIFSPHSLALRPFRLPSPRLLTGSSAPTYAIPCVVYSVRAGTGPTRKAPPGTAPRVLSPALVSRLCAHLGSRRLGRTRHSAGQYAREASQDGNLAGGAGGRVGQGRHPAWDGRERASDPVSSTFSPPSSEPSGPDRLAIRTGLGT